LLPSKKGIQPTVINAGLYSFLCLSAIVIFLSCAKERSCEGCRETNKPPLAMAGPDQVIVLPLDSIQMDGSASSDPDGTIKAWSWKKISGPLSFLIVNSEVSKTVVKNLDSGVYRFELTVKDDMGLAARDTIQILVNARTITNRPPIANAGADQIITLPTNKVTINASGSTDPDNNIASYLWTKISGPPLFNIGNANLVQTQVSNLAEGVYLFELKVSDSAGLFSKDSVQVTVKKSPSADTCLSNNRQQVNASLMPFATLSDVPWAVTSTDNKMVFINGNYMEVYNMALNAWSKVDLDLSPPRSRTGISVIGAGNKIFFAGGDDGSFLHNLVDIYDFSTNTWARDTLSRVGDFFSTVVCGKKVFFAGGNQGVYVTTKVDIYDLTTGNWSFASLSNPRNDITAFASSNKVYFTGGDPWTGSLSNSIDIYDNVTEQWSSTTMQLPRVFHAGIAIDDMIYLAGGGYTNPAFCSVETLNIVTGNRTSMNLFGPAKWLVTEGQNAIVRNNQLIFLRMLGGSDAAKFDIYDISSNTWSIGLLAQPIPEGAKLITVNNSIYIAGGTQNKQVWKLEF
jgi:hypothetical protein